MRTDLDQVKAPLAEATVVQYHETGVAYVAEAFPRDVARGLQDLMWRDAERRLDVSRTDPQTWTAAGSYWTGFTSVKSLTARVRALASPAPSTNSSAPIAGTTPQSGAAS